MCRHVGYLGTPIALDELLLRPQHSLLEQAWAPTDMRRGGTVNVDGFGVGWYPHPDQPVRYRASGPMWADANFAELAPTVWAEAVVGAVRSATARTPVVHTACAPFRSERWLFSHNGSVPGWPDSVAALAEKLDPTELMRLEAPVDSALVWALLRHRLDEGQPAPDAVRDTLSEVVAADPAARMNLLLTDGSELVATTWTHSLSVCRTDHAVLIASEPFGVPGQVAGTDSPVWESVPEGHLVIADTTGVSRIPLPDGG